MTRFSTSLQGPVFTVGFDDGGMNVLSSEALVELCDVIASVPGAARVLLFGSTHESLFAAGADMREMARFSAAEAKEFSRLGQGLFRALEELPLLTAVFVDGDCFGGALDLALAFDVRLASARSRFSHPGARIGIVTGFGGTSRWRSAVSPAAARDLFLGNPVIDAGSACSIGLVDLVVEGTAEGLRRIAERFARADPAIVALRKDAVRAHLPLESMQLLARRLYDLYSAQQRKD